MKLKKIVLINLIFILALTACSTLNQSSSNSQVTQTTSGDTSQLPLLTRLVVGTYKLIGSATPLTKDEAAQLTILWKAYQELQGRDTTAAQEVTDLLDQIQSNLSANQIAAIETMNLSMKDVMSLAQELDVTQTASNPSRSSANTSTSSTSSSNRPGNFQGGMPGGGMPPEMAGGGFIPGGETTGIVTPGNMPNGQNQSAVMGDMSTTIANALVDSLIQQLETVAGTAQ